VTARQIIFVKLSVKLMKVASRESFCVLTFTAMKTFTNVTTATTNAVTFARFPNAENHVQKRLATLSWMVITVVIGIFAIISAKTQTAPEYARLTSLISTSDTTAGRRIVDTNVSFVKDSASSPITFMIRA
jgi:hypothetical protein